jgi:predicted metal-dependent hydrolase
VESDILLSPGRRSTAQTWLPLNGEQVPLFLVRHPRARRYRLRLRPDGSARVTIPRGGSAREGRAFAEQNLAWLEGQLRKLATQTADLREWRIGGELWLRGERVRIEAAAHGEEDVVRFGTERLRVSDPAVDLRPAIEEHLWRLAKSELPPRVWGYAGLHQLRVRRVSVRNQRARWGSCSRLGTISLNWRLVQTPAFVRDYVVLHELCHLRQMNHSARFWAEVERLCPDYAAAESWLREHSARLR